MFKEFPSALPADNIHRAIESASKSASKKEAPLTPLQAEKVNKAIDSFNKMVKEIEAQKSLDEELLQQVEDLESGILRSDMAILLSDKERKFISVHIKKAVEHQNKHNLQGAFEEFNKVRKLLGKKQFILTRKHRRWGF